MRKKLIEIELKYNRTTGFLIGLVVALNLLFCALEYRSGNGGGDDSDIDLIDLCAMSLRSMSGAATVAVMTLT